VVPIAIVQANSAITKNRQRTARPAPVRAAHHACTALEKSTGGGARGSLKTPVSLPHHERRSSPPGTRRHRARKPEPNRQRGNAPAARAS